MLDHSSREQTRTQVKEKRGVSARKKGKERREEVRLEKRKGRKGVGGWDGGSRGRGRA